MTIGKKTWAMAEGYIPPAGGETDPTLVSHETWCILNASDEDATVEATVYFSDRDPAGPFVVTVPARRTLHLRVDKLSNPERIPRETDYSAVLTSNVPVVVQHTRLDTRQAALGVFSTIAFGG